MSRRRTRLPAELSTDLEEFLASVERQDERNTTGLPPPPDSKPIGYSVRPAISVVPDTVAGPHVELVEDDVALARVAKRCMGVVRLAVDGEAAGLHAYRATLCTLQLAFVEAGEPRVVVVDTLAAHASILADVMSEHGPIKVLHDLTFDARLLAEAGARLARVRDTSVTARMLGEKQTGLAALLGDAFGLDIDKRYQHHDWRIRPLSQDQIAYLVGDVTHLLELDARLAARARALDIEGEIADECLFKLATAAGPPRDTRPAHARIRGGSSLDVEGRAILRRLAEERDAIAEQCDVPPFKVIGNEVLLDLAKQRPRDAQAIQSVRGATGGRAGRFVKRWIGAIERGIADAKTLPVEALSSVDPAQDRAPQAGPGRPRRRDPRREVEAIENAFLDRAGLVKLRRLEQALTSWRKAEAERRGVDEQAVLPGHCARAIATVLAGDAVEKDLRQAIAETPGFGARRAERYADALVALARA